MIETIPHHAQNRIAGTAGKPRCLGHIAIFNCGENFLDPFRIPPEPAATPPNASLDHNRERNDRHDQNRPHHRAAFVKLVDQPVATQKTSRLFRSGCSSCSRTRRSGCSRTCCANCCGLVTAPGAPGWPTAGACPRRLSHCAWLSAGVAAPAPNL